MGAIILPVVELRSGIMCHYSYLQEPCVEYVQPPTKPNAWQVLLALEVAPLVVFVPATDDKAWLVKLLLGDLSGTCMGPRVAVPIARGLRIENTNVTHRGPAFVDEMRQRQNLTILY